MKLDADADIAVSVMHIGPVDKRTHIFHIARERTFILKMSFAVQRVPSNGPNEFLFFLSILDILGWRLLLA